LNFDFEQLKLGAQPQDLRLVRVQSQPA